MKFSSKPLTAALILIGAVLLCSTASAIPSKPVPERLVNDFAGLFRPEQKAQLEEMLVTFSDTTSNQIAVVTVNDLEGYDSSEYATRIGLDWKVGTAEFNNGIVVLVKPKTPDSSGDAFIAVGYGLEGAIPDVIATRIVRETMIPKFKVDDYYGGIYDACRLLMRYASGEISVNEEDSDGIFSMLLGFFIVLIIIFLLIAVFKIKGSGNSGGSTGGRGSSGPTIIFGPGSGRGGSSFGGFGGGSFGGGSSFGGFGGGSFGGGGGGGKW